MRWPKPGKLLPWSSVLQWCCIGSTEISAYWRLNFSDRKKYPDLDHSRNLCPGGNRQYLPWGTHICRVRFSLKKHLSQKKQPACEIFSALYTTYSFSFFFNLLHTFQRTPNWLGPALKKLPETGFIHPGTPYAQGQKSWMLSIQKQRPKR